MRHHMRSHDVVKTRFISFSELNKEDLDIDHDAIAHRLRQDVVGLIQTDRHAHIHTCLVPLLSSIA